ncbi:MAG: trypsin-like peptidase domain-containing protein [Williamsia sp.]|nr:trypsin-like peptidase domain-containing protein [Williamsia sp.]
MTKKIKLAAVVLGIAGVTAASVLLANNDKITNSILSDNKPAPALVKTVYENAGPAQPVDFKTAADAAVPSVVHIKTIIKSRDISGGDDQQWNPFGDLFGGGRGGQMFQQPEQRASGSGVIVSADGFIVTNNHVVDGATEVSVTMNNRKNYTAKVIGTDPNTDLALIKVEAKNLPVMTIGNSDEASLGQWVLAIGYPLNLDVTVTQGIISAKSRSIGINRQGAAPVEAFIQTDAAVNPGSSGGALVNTNGELVGINSAIASPTGSYAGYAYAIPSNLVKKVIGDIMKYGKVQRGYLGISMAPEGLDDAKKKELGINDDVNGVWVMGTDPQGAAASAGIKKGDAIIKINDASVSTGSQLAEQVARHKPGDKINVTLVRGGQQMTVSVELAGKMGNIASANGSASVESLGADFSTLNKEDAARTGIPGGVQVNKIRDGVLSTQTNMRPGFIITKIGNIRVKSVEELQDALSKQGRNFQIEGMYPDSDEVYYYGINGFNK